MHRRRIALNVSSVYMLSFTGLALRTSYSRDIYLLAALCYSGVYFIVDALLIVAFPGVRLEHIILSHVLP